MKNAFCLVIEVNREEGYVCCWGIPILLKDNITATKDKMKATTGSFALLKFVLVHATSHHCCAQNWQRSDKLGSKNSAFWLTFWFSSSSLEKSCKHVQLLMDGYKLYILYPIVFFQF